MSEANLFEEMLTTYPAEKRELARQVYHRFADGDSAQFFTQLFLVLDVYAHYAERIPTRMISANADSLATVQEIREEVSLMAKTIESRDVNIGGGFGGGHSMPDRRAVAIAAAGGTPAVVEVSPVAATPVEEAASPAEVVAVATRVAAVAAPAAVAEVVADTTDMILVWVP